MDQISDLQTVQHNRKRIYQVSLHSQDTNEEFHGWKYHILHKITNILQLELFNLM